MTGIIVCMSVAVIGVDYGWQPVGDGGIEYIIQIEPELVDSLKSGHDIFSDLPSSVQSIRSYRITVGTDRLPHQGESPPTSAVVPVGGSAAAEARRANRDRNPPEVDLSQMPGPVLGPALILPGHDGDQEQPRHIAEVEAEEPVRNQTTGYRQPRAEKTENEAEEPANTNAAEHAVDERSGEKPVAAKKNEHEKGRVAEAAEPESPSDQNPEEPSVSRVRPELIQLGLFTSLCCNAFLLWVATGQRSRYRALVRRMFDGIGSDANSLNAAVAVLPRWEPLPATDEPGRSGNAENAAK